MIIEHRNLKFNVPYFVYDAMNAHPVFCVYEDVIFYDSYCIRGDYVVFDNIDEAVNYAKEHFND